MSTTTKNFLSQSPIRSPRKRQKISQIIKSSVNFHHSRPSVFNNTKLCKYSSLSKKHYPRHQWSMKRDEIVVKEINSSQNNFIQQLQTGSYDRIVVMLTKNRLYIKIINIVVFIIDFICCCLFIMSYNLFIINQKY